MSVGAVGARGHGHHLRLHVGRKPGIRRGAHRERRERSTPRDADRVARDRRCRRRPPQLVEHRLERVGLRAGDRRVAAGRGDRRDERTGLDPVGHDRVRRAVQAIDTLDDDAIRSRAGDPRAHRDEAARQIDDFRLARGVLQRRRAVGEGGRHHQVLGAGDGHDVEHETRTGEAPRTRADVTVLEVDLDAHRGEPLHVLVDGAQADRAAAGQRDARLAAARDERPQRQDRRAHRLDELVGGERPVDPRRIECDRARCRRSCATPICASSVCIVRTSFNRGTLVSTSGSDDSSAAQRIGSAAFFAPETRTSPTKGRPPSISSLSISTPARPPEGRRTTAGRSRAAGCGFAAQREPGGRSSHASRAAAHCAGVSVVIDSAWISSRIRSPSAA